MNTPVIRVEGLGKEYVIGAREKPSDNFREMITSVLASPFRRVRKLGGHVEAEERFWALKDVSFEVREGDVVGIIGRNGAGKSTLLKVLSRITQPTEGRAEICGRVASLLEVGTGFHPELTGRENIYLNGAILGMSRAEITRKFDEIVDFAEIEKFLETPVKRYSSGMYVRLAFAVAAHLEPEVLIVDEVLAVGDAEFQKKCLGKMEQVAGTGKTVIFVSHNMAAIRKLCTSAAYLKNGRLITKDTTRRVIDEYMSGSSGNVWCASEVELNRSLNKKLFFTSVKMLNSNGLPSASLPVTEPFYIQVGFLYRQRDRGTQLVLRIDTCDGTAIFSTVHPVHLTGQTEELRYVRIPAMFLMPGSYFVTVSAHRPLVEIYDHKQQVIRFDVIDTGTDFGKYNNYRDIGIIITQLEWTATISADLSEVG